MSKFKLTIGAAVIAISLVLAWVFIPTHVRLSSEVLNKPVGDGFKVLGYKAMSTEPKDGKLLHFFLIDEDSSIKDVEPFLITSDPFIKVEATDENKLSLTINGRVKHLDNDLWVERPDGTVIHWFISADVKYVR
ncbi:hypothetical protein F0231_11665 [Vibrio sp. RE86]|uniref:hypothetical protein n=1 Tax=Vibrio sp. RE86 TaxID=2607605 RepID=UPI001493DB62|nr:hypothetical protein [Vibrio sp. RE86]NOH80395.1 hypothetical protein [Vibrio sp. RE86]